jgi:hypothetical protein
MESIDLDEFILTEMPYFIAVNYQRMLKAESAEEKSRIGIHLFELSIRTLAINLVSQYLFRDRETVSERQIDVYLYKKIRYAPIDFCKKIFFDIMHVYEHIQERLFISELYNLVWDGSFTPPKWRSDIEEDFERLSQIAVDDIKSISISWSELSREITQRLSRILLELRFMGRYDLIQILCVDFQSHIYEYELHRGLKIVFESRSIPESDKEIIEAGWFYLRSPDDRLLRLHPLIIQNQKIIQDIPDVGVYLRYTKHIQYLSTIPDHIITDIDYQWEKDFEYQVFRIIEKTKRQLWSIQRLSWRYICAIATQITSLRMQTVKDKYNAELYLKRDQIEKEFNMFLASEKRCFILIGKSGVGKSSFLLSISDRFRNQSDNIAILMYDAQRINIDQSITHMITNDFNSSLEDNIITNIWMEISKININDYNLILFQ